MKTFKQHIKEDGKMVGTATSNAVEDGNIGVHNIHDPKILNKVNAFVGSIANGEYIKPEAALSQLSAKLSTIGVTVKDKIEVVYKVLVEHDKYEDIAKEYRISKRIVGLLV